jgi:hypothetical protein
MRVNIRWVDAREHFRWVDAREHFRWVDAREHFAAWMCVNTSLGERA